jgi:PIN domain nuclease of toxin-antitoxin system
VALLLDTHAVLWYALDDARLSAVARAAIDHESDRVCVSPASFWELAIKISHRRYTLTTPFREFWEKAISEEKFTLLPIEIRHADCMIALPQLHRDPFDRMLIAQALSDNLQIVSNESLFEQYHVQRVW